MLVGRAQIMTAIQLPPPVRPSSVAGRPGGARAAGGRTVPSLAMVPALPAEPLVVQERAEKEPQSDQPQEDPDQVSGGFGHGSNLSFVRGV